VPAAARTGGTVTAACRSGPSKPRRRAPDRCGRLHVGRCATGPQPMAGSPTASAPDPGGRGPAAPAARVAHVACPRFPSAGQIASAVLWAGCADNSTGPLLPQFPEVPLPPSVRQARWGCPRWRPPCVTVEQPQMGRLAPGGDPRASPWSSPRWAGWLPVATPVRHRGAFVPVVGISGLGVSPRLLDGCCCSAIAPDTFLGGVAPFATPARQFCLVCVAHWGQPSCPHETARSAIPRAFPAVGSFRRGQHTMILDPADIA
jgi:hypothetical protein